MHTYIYIFINFKAISPNYWHLWTVIETSNNLRFMNHIVQRKSPHTPTQIHTEHSPLLWWCVCNLKLKQWMNEWMMHLYSALLCIAVHPKRFTIMWGVSPQPTPVCSIHLDDATAATVQRRQQMSHLLSNVQWYYRIRTLREDNNPQQSLT